jgi:choline monooxygenase
MMAEFQIDPNIAKAQTIHTDFYTSPEVFEECKEKIFAPSWQFIGHESLIENPCDVYPFVLLEGYLDEPLLLTKDKLNQIHLLSNVCTHRGNILAEKACNLSNLRCRYHGRQFDLDGTFLFMPEFRQVENFPSIKDNLTRLELFNWGFFLFTSLEKKFTPDIFFMDMMERVRWMPLKEFVFEPKLSRDFHINANWALYCENYLEGFHIPFVHPGLNSVIDFNEYATELFFPYSSLQIGLAKNEADAFDLPESSPDYGKKVAAYYFWVFPNIMFNFYPWGLSVNVVQPLSPGECRVSFRSYVYDASVLNKGAGSSLEKVEMEDEEIVQNVQKGIRSRFYSQGRYSATREQGTHHFHRLLCEFLQ